MVAEFVDKPSGSIGVVMIHLERAVEREPIIKSLGLAINSPIEILHAVDGKDLIAKGYPTECGIDPGIIRTAGEVGCMVSHIGAMRRALVKELSHLIIFEDDCTVGTQFSKEALQGFFRNAKRFSEDFQQSRDLLLLSTCGCYTWKNVTQGIKITNHFNGSHAYCISAAMMQRVISFYDDLLAKGKTAPIDGVLSRLLSEWAMCPVGDTDLFQQNRDIPSYVGRGW